MLLCREHYTHTDTHTHTFVWGGEKFIPMTAEMQRAEVNIPFSSAYLLSTWDATGNSIMSPVLMLRNWLHRYPATLTKPCPSSDLLLWVPFLPGKRVLSLACSILLKRESSHLKEIFDSVTIWSYLWVNLRLFISVSLIKFPDLTQRLDQYIGFLERLTQITNWCYF